MTPSLLKIHTNCLSLLETGGVKGVDEVGERYLLTESTRAKAQAYSFEHIDQD
ncbi:uncharacterized protein PHALS_09415 [Plasmopara halstedii]|uniref:Uncharacterized protein n=1 Tax=Plasmopara halstedii TaxID=4781 RepID=A0A0P1A5V1_PLAHL|nr:uncharacterized protein PHALS_09415 [Plasmopara halstedii]CEG35288.1 hypothetical protein PHALS_09415 [Plasmopara halstedii]|eukprot:XP_024571657.1 hypothetical protein PHALS_09415 [Plasmopara halstedii]